MPPPPSRRFGVGCGRSVGDCSASGHDRYPQPGPLGLGLGELSAPRADRSRSEYHGRSSPLLQVRRKTTEIVPLVLLIWIGMIFFGLCFTSSGSSIAWRNWQVLP